MTRVHHNPDSWEGWYWGAVHHWGHTLRVGQSETYGTVEDCLQNCGMIVFWAADSIHIGIDAIPGGDPVIRERHPFPFCQ